MINLSFLSFCLLLCFGDQGWSSSLLEIKQLFVFDCPFDAVDLTIELDQRRKALLALSSVPGLVIFR